MAREKSPARPKKPRPDFPLFPHATGRWAKKIKGKTFYFGPWADPQAALDRYVRERDDLYAGRRPRPAAAAVTVAELVNGFLNRKRQLRDTGELHPRTWQQYYDAGARLVRVFGAGRPAGDLAADDFERLRADIAERWGLWGLWNEIQRVRSVFKFGVDEGLVQPPVRYGQAFAKPSKRAMRVARAKKGKRLFTAAEVRQLLAAATPALKAMILLGVNCGYGNQDCGALPRAALDLAGGWADFPRPKSGVERRAKLWPETAAAVRAYLKKARPAPADPAHAPLVFLTSHGNPWLSEAGASPIVQVVKALLEREGLHRPGFGFYTFRHTYATVAGGSRDQVAVNLTMGHADPSVAGMYRERIEDERLAAVAAHVRRWLFGGAEKINSEARRGNKKGRKKP